MKKLLILVLIFVTGCLSMPSNPGRSVDEWFANYRIDINHFNLEDITLEQKSEFISILQDNYNNLTYHTIQKQVSEKTANVMIRIQVTDFSNINKKLENQVFESNKERFDKKLDLMKTADTQKSYTILIRLRKIGGRWQVPHLSQNTILKIHGFY